MYRKDLGLRSGFDSPDLDRPGRQLHQQGLGEARLGCRDGSPRRGPRDPKEPCMYVYYWRTWYKAVGGGKGGSEGHVLRDTTSRGLRGRV